MVPCSFWLLGISIGWETFTASRLTATTVVSTISTPLLQRFVRLRAKRKSCVTANKQEEHGEEDEEKVDDFRLEVFLVEDHRTEEEADDDAAATHHGDDRNHGTVESEGIEVSEVGCGEENADEDDAPVPMEWGGLLVGGPPQEEEHGEHHEELVDVVPRLHGELVESHTAIFGRCHEELVIKT